jgi:hypothetical protein
LGHTAVATEVVKVEAAESAKQPLTSLNWPAQLAILKWQELICPHGWPYVKVDFFPIGSFDVCASPQLSAIAFDIF